MKGIGPLVLGIFGTVAFSWLGLAFVPNLQIGHLDPQSDEEGTDIYPLPQSGMAARGRRVYVANGCFYCHSQQVRADYAASDIDRKWGDRRSAPRDYIFDRPVLLGRIRIGPDLANVGHRAPAGDENAPPNASPAAAGSPATTGATNAPTSTAAASPAASAGANGAAAAPGGASPAASPAATTAKNEPAASPAASAAAVTAQQPVSPVAGAATSLEGSRSESPPVYSAPWHHLHLYSPRSINRDSGMPSYKFLYEKERVGGQPAEDALALKGEEAPGEGWQIVPTYDAKCLVAYLMSLDQSHALKEVKSATPPSPPAPGKSTK
jgi:cbb3-type cytochrome oxidase cytochrome c subunit